ncbi:MAG: hypothetical protein E7633_07155 [Ruminococcaceae bacterium]|nr:hypothetical protein [Oscillospiraceae bacterium]
MDSNGFNNGFENEQKNENSEFFSNDSFEAVVPDKGMIFAEKIRKMFASSAFLTATIAFTVVTGATLVWGSVDIFSLLFTIGMWLAYTTASKGTAPLKDMRFLSGVLKAYYVITVIGIVFLIIAGVILFMVGPAIMNMETEVFDAVKALEENIGLNLHYTIGDETVYFTAEELSSLAAEMFGLTLSNAVGIICVIFGVIFIISAAVSIFINEFFIHKLSKQFKKAIAALEIGSDTELSLNGVRVWFIVIGVFAIISTVSMLATFDIIMIASQGASAVAYFALASAIKGKEDTQSTVQPML